LNTDNFAASYGLPFTPPLPVLNASAKPTSASASSSGTAGAGEGEGEGNREVIRKAKNVNRSLDKLKRQIKEAKAEKKRQRELGAAGITVPTPAAAASVDSDDDLLNSQQKRAKKRKLTKEERALQHGVGGQSGAKAAAAESDDEDFLVPKASVSSVGSTSATMPSSNTMSKSGVTAGPGLFTHAASQNTKLNIANIAPVALKSRKDKPLKITSDGLSKATIHAGSFGKKKTFGDEDEEKGESSAWDKEDAHDVPPEKLAAAAAKFQSLKRKQLSYTKEEDIERDRQRIQSAHRDKRLTERDARQKETTKGVRTGSVGAGAVLGHDSDSD